MPATPTALLAMLPDLGRTAGRIAPQLALTAALFSLMALALGVLVRRGIISRALGGLVKWLAALVLLWQLQHRLPGDMALQTQRLFTLGFLLLGWLIARDGVDFIYAKSMPASGAAKPGRHILHDCIKLCILIVLVGWGLNELLDIQIGSLLTSSAILTAVIGLSMQDTIGSLFSGLLLQVEKPFKEGDWIRVGDVEGWVSAMTWRYTKVVTVEGNEVLLPNNAVAKERLINYDRPEPALRQTLYIPAPPATPPVAVKSAILTALGRAEGVPRVPAPTVRLHEIRDDRLIYAATYHVASFTARLAATDAVLSAVWYQFLESDIDIPPPSRLVFTEKRAQRHASPERLDALAGVHLLAGMRQPDMIMLAKASVARHFAPGQSIMVKGESGTTMFIILSGEVTVADGGRILATLAPGQVFGEMALLTGAPRQADVRAVGDVACLEVDREGFRMALARHPVIVERVRAILAERAAANHKTSPPDACAEENSLFARFRKLFL